MSLAEGELGMVVDSGRGGTSSPVQCGSLEVALVINAQSICHVSIYVLGNFL